MTRLRLTFAGILALGLLWAGAGNAVAESAGPVKLPSARVSVSAGAFKGLKPSQRKAMGGALARCRGAGGAPARQRCVRRVRAKYRRIARRQRAASLPVKPSAIHEILVTDDTIDPIQSSYFIPVPDEMRPVLAGDYAAKKAVLRDRISIPSELTIGSGEAVRFVWDPENRDSAHQISLYSFPAGVDPRDFEMTGSAATGGVTFQRTFLKPGVYEVRCSLHRDTQILELTVTR